MQPFTTALTTTLWLYNHLQTKLDTVLFADGLVFLATSEDVFKQLHLYLSTIWQ